jgi:uncharacterized protein YcfJ
MNTSTFLTTKGPFVRPLARLALPSLLAITVVVGGCTMSETGQRVGTGAAGGAALGAATGAVFGGGQGALIGAGVGAVVGAGTGYVVDQRKKREEAEAETQRLRHEQELERARQQGQQNN